MELRLPNKAAPLTLLSIYHFKKYSNEFFRFAPVLGRQRGRGHVEEGRPAFGGDGLREHGLAGARRANHQDTTPRATNALH